MNYIDIIGRMYPGCSVSCMGNPESYQDVNWEGGDPLPLESQLNVDRLDLLREDKWLEIKSFRDQREMENGTPIGDKWFHSDDASKIKQITLVKLTDIERLPQSQAWKTMDGTFVIMTGTTAYAIMLTAAQISGQIFAVAEIHRQAMLVAEDPTIYDYSNGWPQSFAEYEASLTPP